MNNVSIHQSYIVKRVFAGICGIIFSVFSLITLRTALLSGDFNIFVVSLILSSAIAGIFCWWIVLRYHHHISRERIRFSIRSGYIMGGIGLGGEFLWCALLDSPGNLCPILGIFITGPLGFVLGIIVGYIYVLFRSPTLQTR